MRHSNSIVTALCNSPNKRDIMSHLSKWHQYSAKHKVTLKSVDRKFGNPFRYDATQDHVSAHQLS